MPAPTAWQHFSLLVWAGLTCLGQSLDFKWLTVVLVQYFGLVKATWFCKWFLGLGPKWGNSCSMLQRCKKVRNRFSDLTNNFLQWLHSRKVKLVGSRRTRTPQGSPTDLDKQRKIQAHAIRTFGGNPRLGYPLRCLKCHVAKGLLTTSRNSPAKAIYTCFCLGNIFFGSHNLAYRIWKISQRYMVW